MATVAAPSSTSTGGPTSATAHGSSSSQTSTTSHGFVPIRPAFRPLLPKPFAPGSSGSSQTASLATVAVKPKEGPKKARKSFSSASKHDKPNPARRRTKSATNGTADSHALPSTIAPSSLISKRRKSPAASGLSTILSSAAAAVAAKSSSSTLHSSSSSSSTNKSYISSSSPSSASSRSSVSLASSESAKSDSEASSLSSGDTSSRTLSFGVRSNKKSIASNLMLSSGPVDDLLLPKLVDQWSEVTSVSGVRSLPSDDTLSLSVWDQLSDRESTSSNDLTLGPGPDESPGIDALSLVEEAQDMTSMFAHDNSSVHSIHDGTTPGGLLNDDFVSYSDSLLESYLTPEPDDSEISSYDPLDFLGPQPTLG